MFAQLSIDGNAADKRLLPRWQRSRQRVSEKMGAEMSCSGERCCGSEGARGQLGSPERWDPSETPIAEPLSPRSRHARESRERRHSTTNDRRFRLRSEPGKHYVAFLSHMKMEVQPVPSPRFVCWRLAATWHGTPRGFGAVFKSNRASNSP